jgi:hypothetical protein
MDRNPERITFDPFVLPYETPQDIFSLLFNVLRHTGKRGTLAGLAAGVSVYLLVYTYLCLADMAGLNKAFICTPTHIPAFKLFASSMSL